MNSTEAGPWLVDIKGKPDQSCFEISVIHKDFQHGFQSYGWHGKQKVFIAGNYGSEHKSVPIFVWDGWIKLANEYAAKINSGLLIL